jgi:ADP-heptose:LPS heptosyltransferase
MNTKISKPRIQPKKILVIRRNGLGDSVYTALALKALSKDYPKIKFSILCSPYTRDIYSLISPKIKKYILQEEKFLGHYLGLYFHPLLKKIRREKFDLVINSSDSYSSRAIFIMLCAGAKKIATVSSNNKTFWNFFIDKKIKISQKKESHQFEKVSSIFKQNNLIFSLPKKNISKPSSRPKILICPHSSSAENQWDIENWQNLYMSLKEKYRTVDVCLPKNSNFKINFSHAKQPQNTKSFIKLIKKYNLVISQEGGTGHVAAALKKSLMILSNKNKKKRWAPWINELDFIQANGNLSKIDVDFVFKRVQKYL